MHDAEMNSLAHHLPNVRDGANHSDNINHSAPELEASGNLACHGDCERRFDDAMARASLQTQEAFQLAALQIESARDLWTRALQDRICSEAARERAQFEQQAAQAIVDALSPLLKRKQRDRIRAAFVLELSKLMDAFPDLQATMTGPTAEMQLIVSCFGKSGLKIVECAIPEEKIEAWVGNTKIQADLSKWSRTFDVLFDGDEGDVDGTNA